MRFKSHSKEKVLEHMARGGKAFELETGLDGEDDTLLLENEETTDDLWNDISYYCDPYPIPEHWRLTPLTIETLIG